MQILQTAHFQKAVKRLKKNQKLDLDKAVKTITKDPTLGTRKSGDLAEVQVYKFNMVRQKMLLAYQYQDEAGRLIFLSLGSHENFYRDLKRNQ